LGNAQVLYAATTGAIAVFSTFGKYAQMHGGEVVRPLGLAMLATFWAALSPTALLGWSSSATRKIICSAS